LFRGRRSLGASREYMKKGRRSIKMAMDSGRKEVLENRPHCHSGGRLEEVEAISYEEQGAMKW
jgi:hypothetical protein